MFGQLDPTPTPTPPPTHKPPSSFFSKHLRFVSERHIFLSVPPPVSHEPLRCTRGTGWGWGRGAVGGRRGGITPSTCFLHSSHSDC